MDQSNYLDETVVCDSSTCPGCGRSLADKSSCKRHMKTCKYIVLAQLKQRRDKLTKLLSERTKEIKETRPYVVLQNASFHVWMPNEGVPWVSEDGKHPSFKDYYGLRKIICRESSEELEYATDEVCTLLLKSGPRYSRNEPRVRAVNSQSYNHRFQHRRRNDCPDCGRDVYKCEAECARLERDCDRLKSNNSHWFDGNCSLCRLQTCSVCDKQQRHCDRTCERRRHLCIGMGSQFPQTYHDNGKCRYANCAFRDPAIWCAKCNKLKEVCTTGCERLQEICDELNRSGHGDWHEYHCKLCQQKKCSECGKMYKDCLGQCLRREKRCLQLHEAYGGKFHEAQTCKYLLCEHRDPQELRALCALEKDPFHHKCHWCITKKCQTCGRKQGKCEKDCERLKIVCKHVVNNCPDDTHLACRYEHCEVQKTRKRKREEEDRKCKRRREMQSNARFAKEIIADIISKAMEQCQTHPMGNGLNGVKQQAVGEEGYPMLQ